MDPDVAPRAIVAGHGAFPAGLVSAVEQITGRGNALIPFSNSGLGREEIESGLRDLLALHGVKVIFTDLPGGSATLAARRVQHDTPGVAVVTGVGLAALMDFVFCASDMTPSAAAVHAAEKGRSAIVAVVI
ncbi:MAG: PTS sugar transporter subunit IIA [Gemmatimonadales bacterium]|jgi:PTS system N-acetylgalactosamine-specific IIA component